MSLYLEPYNISYYNYVYTFGQCISSMTPDTPLPYWRGNCSYHHQKMAECKQTIFFMASFKALNMNISIYS